MKKYDIRFAKAAIKALSKLDKPTRVILYSWIKENLYECNNPRLHGKALSGDKKGMWRYRVGDYRIIADIQDESIIILILTVGHRREVYR